jgi:ankyrin repeat protein
LNRSLRETAARACFTGDTRAVRAALQTGTNPNLRYRDRTLLHWAAQEGRDSIVAILLAAGADPNLGDRDVRSQPLHTAAGEGRVRIVRRLLRAGANPNVLVKGMGSPLHLAACYGRLECARALLQAGADPALRDEDGKRAIDYARRYGQREVASLLKEV